MSVGKAQLGYATNAELIAELNARWEFGEVDPGYSTMGGVKREPARVVRCRCGMFQMLEDSKPEIFNGMTHTAPVCFTCDEHGHPTGDTGLVMEDPL
jgi:hypothetical protein